MTEPLPHPLKPIRAQLVRIVQPDDKRFPHDLLLYPTDKLQPEHWHTVWVNTGIYGQFINQWDGKTCPTCQTPTVKRTFEKKYMEDLAYTVYSSSVSYDKFTIYHCTHCHCGWTERTGSESFVETSYP